MLIRIHPEVRWCVITTDDLVLQTSVKAIFHFSEASKTFKMVGIIYLRRYIEHSAGEGFGVPCIF